MSPSSLVSSSDAGYTIAGSKASDIEWRVAVALEKLHLHYIFHYIPGAGTVQRGDIILDFLVLTDPLSTPLDLRGDYWHQPQQRLEDDLFLELALSRGRYAKPVIIYGAELQSVEQAYATVKRELRV